MKKSLLILFGPLVFAMGSLSAQTFLTEDFQGGSIPAGWTASPASPAANAWAVPCVTSAYFTPPAHTIVAGFNDDANQTALNPNQLLYTPSLNLTTATAVILKYDCFYGNGGGESANIKYSLNGGVTWNTAGAVPAAAGWQTTTLNLTATCAGQSNVMIAFAYNDGAQWAYGIAIDNVSIFSPTATDANFTVVTPSAGSPSSFGLVSSNVSFGGTFQNIGPNPITSIAVKYNDGTSTFTDNISSINVASYTTYNFTHNIPYTIPALGAHPIKVWIELAGDADHTNDTLGTIINGAMFIPNHHVTIEECTGTWCGWCVRGMVFMDQANTAHPSDIDLIAVHNGDPMVVTAYDAGLAASGFPTIFVNRNISDDPSNIEAQYLATIGNFGYADLTPTVTFNSTTRVATVVVSAHFAVGLTGDYRLACAFTENQVHGTASTYNQHNYYTGGGSGPMAMPGYDFAVLPDPVPAAQMYYDYVARTIVGGINGQAASLPATIPAGSTQSYTFTYTIPAGYNVANMKAKVLLIDNTQSTKHIMNSAGAAIPLGIESPSALNGVSIYPNPFNTSTNLDINLMSNENVTVEMFDMTGKLVSSQNEGQLNAGQHTISVGAANLSEGMYFVKITAGTSVVTQKVSIAH